MGEIQVKKTDRKQAKEEYWAYGPETFWLYSFEKSREKKYLELSKILQLGEQAEQCGREYALRIKKRYSTQKGTELLAQLGITWECTEETEADGRIILACFTPPDHIWLEKRVEEAAGELTDVFWHHELFHALEYRHKEIMTRQKVKVRGNFGLPYLKGFTAIREIGAMAFAQEMSGLGYSPFLLDIGIMDAISPDDGIKIRRTLKDCHSSVQRNLWQDMV